MIFMIFRWRWFQALSRGLISLHDTCMLCLWNLVGFTTFRVSFLKAGEFLCPFLARQCRLHRNFQFSPHIFDGFFVFSIIWTDEINASESSSVVEFWLHVCPFLLVCLLSGFSNLVPYLRPHVLGSGSCLNFWSTCILLAISRSIKWTLWHLSKNLINFDSRPHSNYHPYVFLQHIQICVSGPWYINVFQWNRECFFFRHMELNSRLIVMTINEVTFE